MARVTYVKRAQQRYETVPVLNEDGTPKRIPVMSTRTGEQKVTKHGKPVFQTVTVSDKSKPLDPYKCETCSKVIAVGDPYKWVKPKSGPYGGSMRVRCGGCPSWRAWDLSNAWWARIAQVTEDFDVSGCESADDVRSALGDLAEAVRELANESRESAENIESGFGHSTYVSDEANQRADELDGWADDIEQAEVPEVEDVEVEDWEGDLPDDETDERWEEYQAAQLDAWSNEVEQAVDIVNNSPV